MITPRPYQIDGVEFLRTHFGVLLADEMGLGKTVQAALAAGEMKGPVLVVARPLNKTFWHDTICMVDPDAIVLTARQGGMFDSVRVRSWFAHPRRRGYLIIHHEMLQAPTSRKTGMILRDFTAELRSYGMWEAVIVDEAHRFKGRKTQSIKSLRSIMCLHKWALSGSMQERTPADYWSILNWFDPKEFNGYWAFHDKYVELEEGWAGGKVKGVKNVDDLARRLLPYYLRRTKSQVQPQLPPKLYKTVSLVMERGQSDLYRKLANETFVQLQEHGGDKELFIGNDLQSFHYLRRCALDPSLLDVDVDSVKVEWLVDWAAGNDEPFIVFTASKMFADNLPVLIKGGATISGSVSHARRDDNLRLFNEGKLRYLSCTYDTTAESVNLQRASVAILTDPHVRSVFMEQSEDRLHRMDIVRSPLIIKLVCEGTIDEVIYAALEKKLNDIELVRSAVAHLEKLVSINLNTQS